MCLDCKSLLGNTKELQTQAPWQYTDHWTQYSLNLWTAEAVINRASELWNRANPENDSPYEITHQIKSSQPNLMILVLL